ncbi:LTA synthase family protein, partial [Enterococcus faecium]
MKSYISRLSTKQKKILKGTAAIFSIFFLVVFSNLFLQWCLNDLSVDLALKLAFSWHTEKFFLACLVL